MYLGLIFLVLAMFIATFFVINENNSRNIRRPCTKKKNKVQTDIVIGNTSSTNSQYIRGSWREDASDTTIGSCDKYCGVN